MAGTSTHAATGTMKRKKAAAPAPRKQAKEHAVMGNRVKSKRTENRRENLRALIQKHGGPKAFADLMGYRTASFVVQMTGPNPSRPVSEDTARAIEGKLGMPDGALDWPVNGARPSDAATGAKISVGHTDDVLTMLIAIAHEERIDVPWMTFAEGAAYAVSVARESGAVPSQDTLRHLVRMMSMRAKQPA